MDEMIKTWPLRFPTNMEKDCSFGQSCRSMSSKQGISVDF